jgi:hypothetical protein
MWEKLNEVFEKTGLPYYRQGNCPAELAETFLTYWNVDTPKGGFYDNESHKNIYFWIVYCYSIDENELYSQLALFIEKAKEHGFKADSEGKDIPSDVENYLGRYVRLTYIKNKMGEIS